MDRWYPKAKEALLAGLVDVPEDDIVVILLTSGYAYSDAHEFLSSVPEGARLKASAPLGSKSIANGILKATDPLNIPAVPADTVPALVVVQDTGDAATSRLLVYRDGVERIDVAVDADVTDTLVIFEDLPTALASGATLTKVSGTGPATIETDGAHDAGDREIAVVALGAALEAGAVYSYQAGMFPLATTGGQVTIDWDDTWGIAAL
jgi:hypothetical protein